MFETHDNSKIPFFGSPGEHYWSSVFVYVNHPWFLVEYSNTLENGKIIEKTVMLSSVEQVAEILNSEDIKLKFAYISSPGHLNGTGRWLTEPLSGIQECESDQNPGEQEYVFVLEDGKQYKNLIGK